MGSVISSMLGGPAAAEGDESSAVTTFHSTPEWRTHFDSVKESSQLMVVDFSASWCGPCRFIQPALNAMAAKFTDVQFAKLDVDELPHVAKEFGVQAMPTFLLLKKGKEVERIVGAKKDELERKIVKHRAVLAAA